MVLARLPVIFAFAIYFTKTTNGQQCSCGNNLKLLLNNGLQSQQIQKNSGSMSVSSDSLNRNVMPESNIKQQMKFQPQFNTNQQNPHEASNNFHLLMGPQSTPQTTKIPLSTLNIVNGKLTLAPTGSISDPQFISAVQSLKANSCPCGNQRNSIVTVSNTPDSSQLTNSQSSSPSIVLTGSTGITNQPSPITLNLTPNVLSFQTNEASTKNVPRQNSFQNSVFTFQHQQSNNQQPLTFNIIPSSPSSQSNTGTPNNLPNIISKQTSSATIPNQPTNNQQSSQTIQIIPNFSTQNSFAPPTNSQNTMTTVQEKGPLNTPCQIFFKQNSDDVINNQHIPLQIRSPLSPQNFPFYTPLSSTSSNTWNSGQKSKQKSSSYLKSLLPLIINILKQKSNEECCHHCNCACVNNQKSNNNQDAPTISSGYSSQINYGQNPKGDSPAFNNNSEEMENDIPSENRRSEKIQDKNMNADGSGRTGADNSDYENSREDDG